MPHLILFDIDGTLVLTGGAGSRALTRAFRDIVGIDDGFRGIPMPGRTDPHIVADALARAGVGVGPAALAQFRARYAECLREEIREPGPRKGVLPGVRQLLDTLARLDGTFLALLTGNYTDGARIKLEYFDLWRYFACGAFGEDAPDRNRLVPVATERARGCGAHPSALEHVIVVGDTPFDVACAHASGARAFGVATGGHSVEELRASGADAMFEDLSDTERFLRLLE
jgi:phosphoglycolate phosphatase-like HAD superfamily hydrolase